MPRETFQCPYTSTDRAYPFWHAIQRQIKNTPFVSLNPEQRNETIEIVRNIWIQGMKLLNRNGNSQEIILPNMNITRGSAPEFEDFIGADLIIYMSTIQRPFVIERFGFIPGTVVKVSSNLVSIFERKEASEKDLKLLADQLRYSS